MVETETKLESLYVMTPSPSDILCGKDKTYGLHPGNQIFRVRIEESIDAYMRSVRKHEKMQFTRDIVRSMQDEYGARFLKPVTVKGRKVWQEISEATARDKVSHALRFAAGSSKLHGTGKDDHENTGSLSHSEADDEEERIVKRAIRDHHRTLEGSTGRTVNGNELGPIQTKTETTTTTKNSGEEGGSRGDVQQPDEAISGSVHHQQRQQQQQPPLLFRQAPHCVRFQGIPMVTAPGDMRNLFLHRQLVLNGMLQPNYTSAMEGMLRLQHHTQPPPSLQHQNKQHLSTATAAAAAAALPPGIVITRGSEAFPFPSPMAHNNGGVRGGDAALRHFMGYSESLRAGGRTNLPPFIHLTTPVGASPPTNNTANTSGTNSNPHPNGPPAAAAAATRGNNIGLRENVLCPAEASIMVGGRQIPCLVLLPQQALTLN